MFVEHPGANQLFLLELHFWQGDPGDPRDIRWHQGPDLGLPWRREMLQWSGLEGIAGLIFGNTFHHFREQKSRSHGFGWFWMVQSYQTRPKLSKSLGSWSSESKSGRSPWPWHHIRYRLWHIPCVLKNRCDWSLMMFMLNHDWSLMMFMCSIRWTSGGAIHHLCWSLELQKLQTYLR